MHQWRKWDSSRVSQFNWHEQSWNPGITLLIFFPLYQSHCPIKTNMPYFLYNLFIWRLKFEAITQPCWFFWKGSLADLQCIHLVNKYLLKASNICWKPIIWQTLFYLLRIWQQTKNPLPQGYYILVQKADYMQINEQKSSIFM